MTTTMQAAQVYFPRAQYQAIKQTAKRHKKPMAAWIREVVQEKLKEESKHVKKKSLKDMLKYSIKGMGKNTSQKIDEIVYGVKRN